MNPGRARRVFWWGLGASILLHLGLLSGAWVLPPALINQGEPPPLTARIVNMPPPVKIVAKPASPPPVKSAPPKSVKPAQSPDPSPEPEAISSLPSTPEPSTPLVAPAEPALPVATEAAPSVPPGPGLNSLPRRLTLLYRARYGLAAGQQTLLWVNEGDHYTITSIVSPEGMASLFFSGQLVQTSRGRIVATGLQPEEFWDQRGNKRSQSRFNYATQTVLTESSKGARTYPLPAGLQDAQSLLFQLALTAPPPADSDNAVFNGKKVRNYHYRVVGEESLDTPLGPLRTLHMVRVTDSGAERFEIWLAMDRYYLPVKISTEISGYDAELLVQSIASEN